MDAETLIWILAAGAATGFGALGLAVVRDTSERTLDILVGFTGGVMLGATFFSLLVPALDRGSVWEVVAGFVTGVAFLAALDRFVPHVHARFEERGQSRADPSAAQRAMLLIAALTIHNIPEGLAVGLAFAAGGADLGVPLALAIGIQNIPEGFAAAAPMRAAGAKLTTCVGVGAATGAVEPPAAIAAFFTFEVVGSLLAAGLAFAAGAMLYVVVDELIPESHGHGNELGASLALLAGFLLLLVLDNAL